MGGLTIWIDIDRYFEQLEEKQLGDLDLEDFVEWKKLMEKKPLQDRGKLIKLEDLGMESTELNFAITKKPPMTADKPLDIT